MSFRSCALSSSTSSSNQAGTSVVHSTISAPRIQTRCHRRHLLCTALRKTGAQEGERAQAGFMRTSIMATSAFSGLNCLDVTTRACALALVMLLGQASLDGPAALAITQQQSLSEDNFENVPSELSSQGVDGSQRLSSLFAGQNRSAVEGCTRKCVPTCVRGGSYGGAPGLGPISLRKEVVVFKDGFRSRQYCLSECANVCSLSINGPQEGGSSSSSSSSSSSNAQGPG